MKSSLLNSLFDEEERRPLSISELNDQVKAELERRFSSVWIEGEIVNFKSAASGHWYFTLSDGDSQIRAACYVRNNMRIKFKPFDGLQVQVRGKITLYAPRGDYQILVESLQPVGEGALRVAYEQIKSKLESEGLFDAGHKRELPFLPRRVGVVSSPNGAAFHDILNVISRRTRSVTVTLIPTRVQGEFAGEEIAAAVQLANRHNRSADDNERLDVLIVGRGGGSAEDLWSFNEEIVARAIFDSEIPVISAVGHEIDFTIADLVADMRAPTPSAAAEIVAESEDSIAEFIIRCQKSFVRSLGFKVFSLGSRLQQVENSPGFVQFPRRISDLYSDVDEFQIRIGQGIDEVLTQKKQRLDLLRNRISPVRLAANISGQKTLLAVLSEKQTAAIRKRVKRKDEEMLISTARLESLSPLAVLSRGYSIAKSSGAILRNAASVKTGDNLEIVLSKGKIKAEVLETEN